MKEDKQRKINISKASIGQTSMKRTISFILITMLLATGAFFGAEKGSVVFASVTTADLPKGETGTKWETQLGEGYAAAPTPPLLHNGVLYVGAGKRIYKINKETGTIMGKSSELAGLVGFAMMPPAYGDNKIFIAVGNGQVQALDPVDLSIKWTSPARTGDMNSPIIYDENSKCIFTGTWRNKNAGGEYLCINSANGNLKWAIPHSDGFYWSGAYVANDYVVFGSETFYDEIAKKQTDNSTIYSVNKTTGAVVSTLAAIGNIRSTAVGVNEIDGGELGESDITDYVYMTTQKPRLYKIRLKEDGKIEADKQATITGASTGKPTIYKNKIFFGTSAKRIDVYDLDKLEQLNSFSVRAYPQTEFLLRDNGDNTITIYSTYNSSPGGILSLSMSAKNLDQVSLILKNDNYFLPVNPQFCLCPLICDENGTIYYKNDSGYIMAVSKPEVITAVRPSVKSNSYNSLVISWQKMSGASGYDIYKSSSKDKGFTKLKSVSSSTGKIIDSNLSTGKDYYYKLRAKYTGVDGKTKFSKMSAASNAKPVLNKTTIKTKYIKANKQKKKKRQISVKWNKVPGAHGYVIYKASSKNGKYKAVKTIQKASAKSWTDKKIKSKKQHYYKVRAFRNVSGKKVHSDYSNVSNKKAK